MSDRHGHPAEPGHDGQQNRRRSRRSPRSNSRRASSPTTKKKNTIRPLLIHSTADIDSSASPQRTDSSLCHTVTYDDPATFAQTSATRAAARSTAELPASVLRNRRKGVRLRQDHTEVPDLADRSGCDTGAILSRALQSCHPRCAVRSRQDPSTTARARRFP